MIKRLRKRFIRIATLAVAAVLLVLCVSINLANYISVTGGLHETLRMISENEGVIPHMPPEGTPGAQPGGNGSPGNAVFHARFCPALYRLRRAGAGES